MEEEVFEQKLNLVEIVKDEFVYNHKKILVLDEKIFIENNYLLNYAFQQQNNQSKPEIFCMMATVENNNVIMPLTTQEYVEVYNYYQVLKESFSNR